MEIMVVLFTGLCFNGKGFFYVMLFTVFTIFSFYFIYLVIHQVKRSSDTVQETTYLERIDYLTQLPNNVAIEKHFQVLLKKKANFNLLLVDINDFKIINSLYGYTVGDSVIKQLAQLLQEYAQKNGAFVGRLSGEEFLIIIKDVPPAMAIVEANNIIKCIAKHSFEGSESMEIQISIGLSSYPDNGTDVQSLLKSSNVAHQHAKISTTASYFHANNL